jgi:hypothetical protein
MVKKEVRVVNAKINAFGLGLAGGIIFAVCIFLITLCGILFNWFSIPLNTMIGSYGFLGKFGYDISVFGLLLGTIYGFIEGFLFFWVLGGLYNRLR